MLSFNEADIFNYHLLKEFAHQNRVNMTLAERVLWDNIRANQLGHKFLRQYIIDNYIVDFVCRDEGLVIEVDGAYHCEPRQHSDDIIREAYLQSHGYHILRFTNEEVLYDTQGVVDKIIAYFNH